MNEEEKEISIKLTKSTMWKGITGILLILVIISVFTGGFGFGSNSGSGTGNAIAPSQPSAPTQPSQVTASADDDPFLGNADADVTLIEFSDYQCPFCGRFWSQSLPEIKSQYVDTGKVKFVYRDFPLDSIHPMATPAAIAAECVREQGGDNAYFDYHDRIFTEGAQSLSDANLKQWAQDLGFNINTCLDTQEFLDEVRKDLADAQAAGGRGTPYFVIIDKDGNGIPLSGAQPFSAFDSALKAAGA